MDWPAEDRAKTIAIRIEKAARCQLCGTAEWEWRADPFAYEAMEVTCAGCMQKELTRDPDRPLPPGATITLIPKGQVEAVRNAPPLLGPRGVT